MTVMTITSELAALNAPRKVREAGREIEACLTARIRPPAELVAYVQTFVARQSGQDRWGK